MINENVLEFGYGDIAVGANPAFLLLTFQGIKPPHKCGARLNKCIEHIGYTGHPITISFESEKECLEFKELLTRVENKEIELFEFKSFIFDFSNYNEESIKVCQTKLNIVYVGILSFMAA